MSIMKIIFKPKKVSASSEVLDENWNLSKEEWKKKLSSRNMRRKNGQTKRALGRDYDEGNDGRLLGDRVRQKKN